MKIIRFNSITLTHILLFFTMFAYAHPTGNLISVGDHVLWSYINPINDLNHYACVMISKKGSEPKVYIQSDYAASDFMLSNNRDDIYIIERKYLQDSDEFKVRVLKATVDDQPKVIWNWFKDDYKIGEGGFFMVSDDEMVFSKYPEIFSLKKGEHPKKHFEFHQPIKRIRAIENNLILLLADSTCYLVEKNGTILKQWDNLIDTSLKNAPLNRNQIFDADYCKGELLLSYWGRRSFDLIDAKDHRQIIMQQTEPLTPHWVAFLNNEKWLFSSQLSFNGSMPKPHLIRLSKQNHQDIIWSTH
ncbi:MAG: hypothetical protein GYB35_04325 [Algicola sp.]|nr:hypothetical protein [Algicola sp.]